MVATSGIVLDDRSPLMPHLIPVAAARDDAAVVGAGPKDATALEKKKNTTFHQVSRTSVAPAAIPAAEVAEAGPKVRSVVVPAAVAVVEEAAADPRMIAMQD